MNKQDVPYSSSKNLGKVRSASLAAPTVCNDQLSIQADKEYIVRKNVEELEAVRVLFNDDKDSKTY